MSMDESLVLTEADTCREFVTPALQLAGWGKSPHAIGEQHAITAGRIALVGGKPRRGKQRRADYILYLRRDFPIAVVEAKEAGLPAENGVQQAREYAEMLGLRFAYATNGRRIIEIDYDAGTEREIERYPSPDELWARRSSGTKLPEPSTKHWLEPYNLASGRIPRYYQDIAINRVIEAILLGQQRVLVTLATDPRNCVAVPAIHHAQAAHGRFRCRQGWSCRRGGARDLSHHVAALKSRHTTVREANAALLPAALERLFA